MLGSSSRSEQPATSSGLPVTRVPCPIGHLRVERGARHPKPPRDDGRALDVSRTPEAPEQAARYPVHLLHLVRRQPDLVGRLHVLLSIGSAVPTRVMEAKEAASFVRLSESEFERMAPRLPRYAVTERRYIYLRSELLAWLLGR
jgi:hypothetical protein